MLVSRVRDYIKEHKKLSITDLEMGLNRDREELDIPLNILESKGLIKKEMTSPSDKGCGGCSMGCSSKAKESCSTTGFTIYTWIG